MHEDTDSAALADRAADDVGEHDRLAAAGRRELEHRARALT